MSFVRQLVNEEGSPFDLNLRPSLKESLNLSFPERCTLVQRKGNHVAIDSNASAIRDRRQRVIGMVFVLQNVSEQRLLSLQLTRAARYDSLTGLLNREAFEVHLSQVLEDCRVNDASHVVCFMDLDRFKIVNDSCGHPAGDQLLQRIANLIRERVRDTDGFARLGGDEFGLLLPDCPPDAALRAAVRMIERLSALDCRWALDDFGSGMSSYSYLRQLPVDYLKIDGNIVADVVTNPSNPLNREMVRSINQIGHVMNLKTIAESVSNDAELTALQE